MNKNSTLFLSLMLMVSPPVFADRPAMEDSTSKMSKTDSTTPGRTSKKTIVHRTMGDAVEITRGETIDIKLIDFPSRGMSMRKVLNELGKPNKTPPGVGNPPIRLWIYDDRTIYFENMTVIHVVAKP